MSATMRNRQVVLAFALLLLSMLAGFARAQTINEFSVGITAGSGPLYITAGPDNNLWFTEYDGNRIGRITPAGVVTQFSTGISAGAYPSGIAAGSDGNLWFTEDLGNRIGRITTAGVVTQFSSGITLGSSPLTITTGPTGTLWFTEGYYDQVGRILTASGAITEFSNGISAFAQIGGITLGPDGNLWFTETGTHQIGRITPAGVVTEFYTGITYGSSPFGITAGPDGNLWFTERIGNQIGRITTSGVVTEFYTGISPNAGLTGITAGPDGNLWFTEFDGNRIGRITPTGVVTEFSTGLSANAGPNGITAGPDGNIWFTEYSGNRIGRVTLPGGGAPTATTGVASAISQTGATLNGTVSAHGAQTTVTFNYGLTTSYGNNVIATQSPLAGTAVNAAVSAPVTALTCGSVYHFRVTASNTGGNVQGSDATFSTAACPTVVTGNNPAGPGTISSTLSGCGANCGFTRGTYIATSGAPGSPPESPPAGFDFPYGLFDFSVSGVTPGSAITITIVYPASLPADTLYWKYGPTPGQPTPHWYIMPATVSGSQVQFTIVDGGLGDDDLTANGSIVEPGGPGTANGTVDLTLNVDSNVDAETRYDALTDGMIMLRYLSGLTGDPLISGVLGSGATLTDPTQLVNHLNNIRPVLDVDANGQVNAQTDGLLIIRYLFGLRGSSLIDGAIGPGATRTTTAQIEAYIQNMMP